MKRYEKDRLKREKKVNEMALGRSFKKSIPSMKAIMNGDKFPQLTTAQRMAVLVRLPRHLKAIMRPITGRTIPKAYIQEINGFVRETQFTKKETKNLFRFLLDHFMEPSEACSMVRSITTNEKISITGFYRCKTFAKWAKRHRSFMIGTM